MHGSQNAFRARVKDTLGETVSVSTVEMTRVVANVWMNCVVGRVYELLEIDPADQLHLFHVEMKHLFCALRVIELKDSDDVILELFIAATDELSNVVFP